MPVIRTEIHTDDADRLRRQLLRHATAMASPRGHRIRAHGGHDQLRLRVDDHDDSGTTLHFEPLGTCHIHATTGLLTVRIEAREQESLQRIQDTVTGDLKRFGRRSLEIIWVDPQSGTVTTTEPEPS